MADLGGELFYNGSIVNDKSIITAESDIYDKESNSYTCEITIKYPYKLADLFYQLPYGIVDKSVTGIGATYLELQASRDSIVVVPLKSIAYSKSNSDFLYVGSPTGDKKDKVSVKQIINYIVDRRKKPAFKKILVVADSLPKVIEAIHEVGGIDGVMDDSPFKHWFFVVDEIDSFQTDSDYRPTIEKCIDYYKMFPKNRRCMVSATIMEFSDPFFKNEDRTIIKYDNPPKSHVYLIHTNNAFNELASNIKSKLDDLSEEKILVAFTALDHLVILAKHLDEEKLVNTQDIKIMCSESNYEKAGVYYSTITNDTLPGKVNFITSAYFTGVDIKEKFHLISCSDCTKKHTLLSNHKLKQIAGRGRKGLISETIIFSTSKPYQKSFTKEELFEIANTQIEGFKCFEKHFLKNQFLRELEHKLHDTLVEVSTAIGKRTVRNDINNEIAISYLNIDGILEEQRVLHIYSHPGHLLELLKEEHDVEYIENNWEFSGNEFDTVISKTKTEYKLAAIENLKALDESDTRGFYDLKLNPGTSEKQEVYDQYEYLIDKIDKNSAIAIIEKMSLQRDNKEWKNLQVAIAFMIDDTPFKRDILSAFPLGQRFTDDEIYDKLNKIYSYHKNDASRISTPRNAVTIFNQFFEVKNPRIAGKRMHVPVRLNPKKLTLLKK
jgi:hypothetical protein